MQKYYIVICVLLFSYSVFTEDLPYIPNYGVRCMRCICTATIGDCDLTLGCKEGYCGPFRISRVYWIDAGNITLPQDTPERNNAYEDCALEYNCAQRILLGYFHQYARDCNSDGVTNCDDYAMLHVNGRGQCHPPVNRTERGKAWWDKYTKCDPLDRAEFRFQQF
ncbi:lysozyme-like isoform X2 [Anoplophora glabripennis]|uniref:lysozyme-like isoform X2 n=1 Tax=Anoplophora glabripennis TaxID=217634 RepID=UPI000874FB56|nr:lysozyme-like isoform X2 [Anoplophora glabripennis]